MTTAITKPEKKVKLIGFKVTDKEHDKIVKYCEKNDITISVLVRHLVMNEVK